MILNPELHHDILSLLTVTDLSGQEKCMNIPGTIVMAVVWSTVTCYMLACQLASHGFSTVLAPVGVSPNNSSLGFPCSNHSIEPIVTAQIFVDHGVMISS